ncbi:MAG: magnesium/cobalt transporter CorA [Myxococcota bacterium]|nr:magnesium/cobalt transporter CorA [Myxococcota bacterium]MDW8362030.1 magnesium/cobalt transporter CorA [Myxococcales bacterium]
MTIRCYAFRPGEGLSQPSLDALPGLLADPDVHLWIDLEGADSEIQALLGGPLGLHPVVVEDILLESQPKLEDYGDFLYVIVHGIDGSRQDPLDLGTLEIDLVLGSRWLVTHHDGRTRSIPAVRAQLERDPALLERGPAFVLHAVLDHLTDHYAPVMEKFDQLLERLEYDILKEPRPELLEQILALKHSLQTLRRIGVHQKELLGRLALRGCKLVPEGALPFFRDILDHFTRVSDLTEVYREMTASALQAYLSMQNQKLNEVMKFLTMISTVMLPLSFIAGIYGMNFEHMPELRWKLGYPAVLLVMAVVATGLYIFFRRRRFL